MMKRCLVLAIVAPLAGCSFYFGGDDTGDDCETDGSGDAEYPQPGLRNPDNGQCEYYGGGGGCGYPPYDYADESGAAYEPDWASCASGCEGLDELTCQASASCRTTYVDTCGTGFDDCEPSIQYNECWGMAPSGPASGACEGLDAYGCSQHNDCAAIYTRDYDSGYLTFVSCQPETVTGCYSDEQCPAGYECTADTECLPPPMGDAEAPVCWGTCVPSTNTCDIVDCGPGYHCEEECSCDDADGDGMCEPQCTPVCVPDWNTCSAVDCGPGYHCEELCYPCDPLPDGTGCEDGPYCEPICVPDENPTCDAVDCGPDAHCEIQCYPTDPTDPTDPPTMDECYPVCVPNTSGSCDMILCEPGTHCEETCVVEDCTPDGECPPPYCYGECIPDGPTDVCEALQTEAECVARPDCVPVYTGEDCICYPWGCECSVLTYERCETGFVIDPDPLKAGAPASPLPRILARPRE
jgi:hypothetical protein